LRENFTVDYEKERARLESYRDINAADFSPEKLQAQAQAQAAQRGPSSPPLMLDDDSAFSSSDDGFASSAPPPPPVPSGPAPAMRTGAVVSAIAHGSERTNTTAANVPAPRDSRSLAPPTPVSSSSTKKWVALAATLTTLVVGAAIAAMVLLKPTTTVVVNVQGPPEAQVRFDALPAQSAAPSLTLEKIAAGQHTLIVEAKGFVPYSMAVVTEGQALQSVKVEMKRVSGRLTVTSSPSGAAIMLDGKLTDKLTPATFDVDGDSIHEVRLSKVDFKEAVKSDVRVKGGEEVTEKLQLLPSLVRVRVATTPEGATIKVGDVDFGLTPVVIERSPEDPYPQITLSAKGCDTMQTTVPFDREKAEDRFDVTLKCKAP
jgi:hypothetical protein